MNIFDDDSIPTPAECFREFQLNEKLAQLDRECMQRKSTIDALRYIEQGLRKDIVTLSDTLSRLYSLAGTLSQAGMQKNEEE
jgi:tRNA uridine 5-carbamoylmethylation protein Kti12